MKYITVMSGTLIFLFSSSYGRMSAVDSTRPAMSAASVMAATPAYNVAQHTVGKLGFIVTNMGILGGRTFTTGIYDCFTGLALDQSYYPRWSEKVHLFSASYWVGGIVGGDTLVSVGSGGWILQQEFNPDIDPYGRMAARSLVGNVSGDGKPPVSEQDFVAICYDTTSVPPDTMAEDPRIPLNLKLTHESYTWSYAETDDFILIHITIENIGPDVINDMYFGIFADADNYDSQQTGPGYTDDITGFLNAWLFPNLPPTCHFLKDYNIAWAADNNGDLRAWPYWVPHAFGFRMLGSNPASQSTSYNWYLSNGNPALDWGPMRTENYRQFAEGQLGTPITDADKYYIMSNGEQDFDQIYASTLPFQDSGWIPPPSAVAEDFADGWDTRYLLSHGPYQVAPGEKVTVDFAYVAGPNLHRNSDILDFLPDHPDWFYSNLRFDSLVTNSQYAEWVWDNPGVDTDSDGYAGEYIVCEGDTVWISGDGIPDFRAGVPPEAPELTALATDTGLYVRWNGFRSETVKDLVLKREDFEGYRVYRSFSNSDTTMLEVAEYDRDDYHVYVWDSTTVAWVCTGVRLSLQEARCKYAPNGCADSMFAPADYTRDHPYFMKSYPHPIVYFVRVGCNRSEFGRTSLITKPFPDAPKPIYKSPSDVPPDSLTVYLTDDGQFKYYEYQLPLGGLTPGETYNVAVTAFDYGSYAQPGLAMESPLASTRISVTVPSSASCCAGSIGNVDNDPADLVDISDLIQLIDFLFTRGSKPACHEEANIDCDSLGEIDIVDITRLVDYLFISRQPLCPCSPPVKPRIQKKPASADAG